jgi:chromosome segregation ATPase
MFSGRRAFEGDGPAALSAAINTSMPPSCGSPALDRLLSNCLAKDPAARWQRMHKILMELKLLTVLARRAETPLSVRREQAGVASLRAEMQQLEGRVAARLQACENTVANTDHAAAELRGQLAEVNAQLTAAREQQASIFEGLVGASETRLAERFGRDTEAVDERVGHLEQAVEAVRQQTATLHQSVSEDFLTFEQGLKSQAAAIESTRTAMAQTDDLVERVVDALESLQTFVLDPHADASVTIN